MNKQLNTLDDWVKKLENSDPTEAVELYAQIVSESKSILTQLNTLNDTVKQLTHEANEIIHDDTNTP